ALKNVVVHGDAQLGNNSGDLTISTTGQQTYKGKVTVLANTSMVASAVTFEANVDTAEARSSTDWGLMVMGDLETKADATIGGMTRFKFFTVTGTSKLGGNVMTTGEQKYGEKVSLTQDVILDGDSLDFNDMDGIDGGGNDLSLQTAMQVTINEAFVGIKHLNVLGAGGALLSGEIITTGNQVYESAVSLAANTDLKVGDDGSGIVHFMGAVDSASEGDAALAIKGALQADETLGKTSSLESLCVTGTSQLNGDVVTLNNQIYMGTVILTSSLQLKAVNEEGFSRVFFHSDVKGGNREYSLDLEAATVIAAENVRIEVKQVRFGSTIDGRHGNGEDEGDTDVSISSLQPSDPDADFTSQDDLPQRFTEEIAGNGNSLTLAADNVIFQDDISLKSLNMEASGDAEIRGKVTLFVDPHSIVLPTSVSGEKYVDDNEEQPTSLTFSGVHNKEVFFGSRSDGPSLQITDFTEFKGHTIFGGNIFSEGHERYYEGKAFVINSSNLILSQEIVAGGAITFLGGDITFQDGGKIESMEGSVDLLAAGLDSDGSAIIDKAKAERQIPQGSGQVNAEEVRDTITIKTPASDEGDTVPAVTIVATDGVYDAFKIILDLSGGEVDVATGLGQSVQFNTLSKSSDSQVTKSFEAFIGDTGYLSRIGISVASAQVFTVNPAPSLILVIAIAYIDLGLFEQALTLYGLVGTGIALDLAQCEEEEGCAPRLTEGELDLLIVDLQEKLRTLQEAKDTEIDPARLAQIDDLVEGYRMQLQEFQSYLQTVIAFREAAEVDDEELSLEEDIVSFRTLQKRELAVDESSNIIQAIFSRINWLERLKEQPEERQRLSEVTGIELTIEALDEIIDATKREEDLLRRRVRLILQGESEISMSEPPVKDMMSWLHSVSSEVPRLSSEQYLLRRNHLWSLRAGERKAMLLRADGRYPDRYFAFGNPFIAASSADGSSSERLATFELAFTAHQYFYEQAMESSCEFNTWSV
ncbi:MAG: hypothetical protein ACYYK0_07575, partial [Candidatus Eutrophobiaceae bacterium]